MNDPVIFPLGGGLNGDEFFPDNDYEDLFEEDRQEIDDDLSSQES